MENNSEMGNVKVIDKGFEPGELATDFTSILTRFEINKYSKKAYGSSFTYTSKLYSDMEYDITKLATYLSTICKTEREVDIIVLKTHTEINNLFELIRLFLKINSGNNLGEADNIIDLINEVESSELPEEYKFNALKNLNTLKKLGTEINLVGIEARYLITKEQRDGIQEVYGTIA